MMMMIIINGDVDREAQRLQHTYYPLEVDPSIGLEQKYKYMEEWVTLAHEALIKVGGGTYDQRTARSL